MPLTQSFTARAANNVVHTFNLLNQVNGDATTRRLDTASVIGRPQLITAASKVSKPTAARVFPVDILTLYSNLTYDTEQYGESDFGFGITMNMPRVGLTAADVQLKMETLHLYLVQYIANLEYASADMVAGKVPWTMPGIALLANGIR